MSPGGGGQPPGVLPQPDRGPVAVQGLGPVLVPRGGGAVGVQDQGPAPLVDHDILETLAAYCQRILDSGH